MVPLRFPRLSEISALLGNVVDFWSDEVNLPENSGLIAWLPRVRFWELAD